MYWRHGRGKFARFNAPVKLILRTNWYEQRSALEIYDRREGFRVETCPSDQNSVQFFLSHQALDVVGLDAAAVQDSKGGGVGYRKLMGRAFANEGMSSGGDFRRRHF